MSMEEFLNHIEKFERLEAIYEKKYEGFNSKLPGELTEVVYTRLPNLEERHKKQKDEVLKLGEKYVAEIWEWYNHAYSLYYSNQPVDNSCRSKKRETKVDAQKRLESNMKDLPLKYQAEYSEMFWETYEDEQVYEAYEHAVFKKMKEVFAEFYLDDILDLESEYLRYFDSSIYLMCTCQYIQEVYKIFKD